MPRRSGLPWRPVYRARRLVLFEGGCGSEYFGQQAVYIRPDDVAGIRRGVQAALDRKRSKNLAEHVCTYFSWKAVARALRDAYGQVVIGNPGRRTMIAHIRQPKQPEPATPIIRARHMVAETLLPDEPAKPRRRAAVRKVLLFGGLVLLAVVAALAYYSWR